MKPEIIVLGSSGFIGKYLSNFLNKKLNKYKIIHFVKNSSKYLDVTDQNKLEKYIGENTKFIINFSGQNSKNTFKINKIGNDNIIKLLRAKNLNPIYIFASSTLVYKYNHKKILSEKTETRKISNNPYINGKLNAERIIEQSNLNYYILRFSNVYDFNFTNRNLIRKLALKNEIKINNLNIFRSYVNIIDINRIILRLISKKFIKSEIFNISNENLSIQDLVFLFQKYKKKKIKIFNNSKSLRKMNSQKISNRKIKKFTNIKNLQKIEKAIKKFYL
ncbi:WcaG Nucleoside-diphosphate-sugar epimerases [Candidatus Pelagibacterales bacterium]